MFALPAERIINRESEVFSTTTDSLVENLYNKIAKIPKNCWKKHLHYCLKKFILKSVESNIKTTNKKNKHERSDDEGTKRDGLRRYSSGKEESVRKRFFLAH